MLDEILDPFKPPSWRWEAARQFFESKQRFSNQQFDPATKEACRFLAAEDSGDTDSERYFNAQKFPHIYQARKIHQHDNMAQKWGIQARLLADEDRRQIARKHHASVETVNWYARLFYDVEDSLDCPDYILNVVIGESIHRGINAREYDLLWKFYGFFHGPLLVDALSHMTTDPKRTQHANQVNQVFGSDHRASSFRKSSIAMRTLPIAFNEVAILELHNKLLEMEKSGDNVMAGAEALLHSHIAAACAAAGKSLKPASSRGGIVGEIVNGYDGRGVELRASELTARDAGIVPESHQLVYEMADQAKERKFVQ